MVYRLCPKRNDVLHVTERHSGSEVAYCSKREMEALYPRGSYEIIGEIGNFAKEYAGQDIIATDTGKRIPVFPRGHCRKPFEWVAGFAAVGENTYVAVIKGVFPRWIRPFTAH